MANFTGASELQWQPDKQQDLCESATAGDEFLLAAVTVAAGRASADNPWVEVPQPRSSAVCWSLQSSREQTHGPPPQVWPPVGPWLVARGPAPRQSNAPVHC